MGKYNQPKNRQRKQLERKEARIQQFERILIVSEGSKTEPNYLKEILQHYRIPTANYCILPSELGTAPLQVVQFAYDLFLNGDAHRRIKKRSFERVYAVFDRDDHKSYHEALVLADRFGKEELVNDQGEKILFQSVVSVPNFELWFLLHFKLVSAPISRKDVLNQLKKYIPKYEKGKAGYFELIRNNLNDAINNSKKLAKSTDKHDGKIPYTDIGNLVEFLMQVKT
jgi:hypothetical protein